MPLYRGANLRAHAHKRLRHVEARRLHLPDMDESRSGVLLGVYRYFGDYVKAGVGYNFTDFSENLTDLSYRHQGVFVNVVGAL